MKITVENFAEAESLCKVIRRMPFDKDTATRMALMLNYEHPRSGENTQNKEKLSRIVFRLVAGTLKTCDSDCYDELDFLRQFRTVITIILKGLEKGTKTLIKEK